MGPTPPPISSRRVAQSVRALAAGDCPLLCGALTERLTVAVVHYCEKGERCYFHAGFVQTSPTWTSTLSARRLRQATWTRSSAVRNSQSASVLAVLSVHSVRLSSRLAPRSSRPLGMLEKLAGRHWVTAMKTRVIYCGVCSGSLGCVL